MHGTVDVACRCLAGSNSRTAWRTARRSVVSRASASTSLPLLFSLVSLPKRPNPFQRVGDAKKTKTVSPKRSNTWFVSMGIVVDRSNMQSNPSTAGRAHGANLVTPLERTFVNSRAGTEFDQILDRVVSP